LLDSQKLPPSACEGANLPNNSDTSLLSRLLVAKSGLPSYAEMGVYQITNMGDPEINPAKAFMNNIWGQ
jgi:hypothetical protein